MDERISFLAEMIDREFEGNSFNGKSLLATLRDLSLEQALFDGTQGGYSVFAVTLHVAYYKYLISGMLGGKPAEFPYERADFPALPDPPDKAAWENALERLKTYHDACRIAIESLTGGALEAIIPAWKVTARVALEWYATHDIYHTAQIRNMGVPGL